MGWEGQFRKRANVRALLLCHPGGGVQRDTKIVTDKIRNHRRIKMRFYFLILCIPIILTIQASELDAQSSGYFPIGVWCTAFDFEPNQPDDKLVPQIERDLIRDLGITYLIACPAEARRVISYFRFRAVLRLLRGSLFEASPDKSGSQ